MWPAVIVFAALVTWAVVAVIGYLRADKELQAARADAPVTPPRPDVQPEPDETLRQTDSWIWR
ncbi:MAG TPA: hypothetical protein VGL33_09910 [Streptosporangiaceae bacterium]|jgi:hypothetical protein